MRISVKEYNIKKLRLDWFGGEPFLYFDEVIDPLSKDLKTVDSPFIRYPNRLLTKVQSATRWQSHRTHVAFPCLRTVSMKRSTNGRFYI